MLKKIILPQNKVFDAELQYYCEQTISEEQSISFYIKQRQVKTEWVVSGSEGEREKERSRLGERERERQTEHRRESETAWVEN